MFRHKVAILLSFLPAISIAQFVIDNEVHNSGLHKFCRPGSIVSPGSPTNPVSFSGSAIGQYFATEQIHLTDGFKAEDFNSTGGFRASIIPVVEEVVIIEPGNTVGKYEKIEFGIQLPTDIQDAVELFLNGDNTLGILKYEQGLNPFNPEHISVEAIFTSPEIIGPLGILVQPADQRKYGFFYKGFDRQDLYDAGGNSGADGINDTWAEVPSIYPFRVRFAPDITGDWSVVFRIVVNGNSLDPCNIGTVEDFVCVNSTNKGYLQVAASNRYLEFNNGDQYFGVGLNVAGPDAGCYPPVPMEDYQEQLDYLVQVANTGANAVRFLTEPTRHMLEMEEHQVGNYYENMNRAWEQDKLIEQCETHDLYTTIAIGSTAWLQHSKVDTNSFGDIVYNSLIGCYPHWDSNPYKLAFNLENTVDFYSDEATRKAFKNRLRYTMARWGYSTNISNWQLMNEYEHTHVIGTNGTRVNVSDNENPNKVADMQAIYDWHAEMATYIKTELGNRNHLLSADQGSVIEDAVVFAAPNLDLISFHPYFYDRNRNVKERFEKAKDQIEEFQMPLCFAESGINVQHKVAECTDVAFHNDIWASSFMGTYSTGLNWWWNRGGILDQGYEFHFTPLVDFMYAANLEENQMGTGNFGVQRYPENALVGQGAPGSSHDFDDDSNPLIEAFVLLSPDGNRAVGWIHNRTNYWYNLQADPCIDSLVLSDSSRVIKLYDVQDDDSSFDQPADMNNEHFRIRNLDPFRQYEIEWVNTISGSIVDQYQFTTGTGIPFLGYKIDIPDTINENHDLTFRLFRKSEGSYRKNLSDSILKRDSIYLTYPVKTETIERKLVPSINNQSFVSVFPNPSNGAINVNVSSDFIGAELRVENVYGQVVYQKLVMDSSFTVDLSSESKGVYVMSVENKIIRLAKRMVIQ